MFPKKHIGPTHMASQMDVFKMTREGRCKDLEALMQSGADVINETNKTGRTLLSIASRSGHENIVEVRPPLPHVINSMIQLIQRFNIKLDLFTVVVTKRSKRRVGRYIQHHSTLAGERGGSH